MDVRSCNIRIRKVGLAQSDCPGGPELDSRQVWPQILLSTPLNTRKTDH